jgi:hypothetical protein
MLPEPATRDRRGEGSKRAHTGPIDFVLRALAALIMLQLLKYRCRNAA